MAESAFFQGQQQLSCASVFSSGLQPSRLVQSCSCQQKGPARIAYVFWQQPNL
jgi:hypothetical protein